jgi:hypothetical protein
MVSLSGCGMPACHRVPRSKLLPDASLTRNQSSKLTKRNLDDWLILPCPGDGVEFKVFQSFRRKRKGVKRKGVRVIYRK